MPFINLLNLLKKESAILRNNKLNLEGQEQVLYEMDITIKLLEKQALPAILEEDEVPELERFATQRLKIVAHPLDIHKMKYEMEAQIRTRNAKSSYAPVASTVLLALATLLVAATKFASDEEAASTTSTVTIADILMWPVIIANVGNAVILGTKIQYDNNTLKAKGNAEQQADYNKIVADIIQAWPDTREKICEVYQLSNLYTLISKIFILRKNIHDFFKTSNATPSDLDLSFKMALTKQLGDTTVESQSSSSSSLNQTSFFYFKEAGSDQNTRIGKMLKFVKMTGNLDDLIPTDRKLNDLENCLKTLQKHLQVMENEIDNFLQKTKVIHNQDLDAIEIVIGY